MRCRERFSVLKRGATSCPCGTAACEQSPPRHGRTACATSSAPGGSERFGGARCKSSQAQAFRPRAWNRELPLWNGGARAVAAAPRTDGLRDLERSRASERRKVQ